jgi:hypothetical protein
MCIVTALLFDDTTLLSTGTRRSLTEVMHTQSTLVNCEPEATGCVPDFMRKLLRFGSEGEHASVDSVLGRSWDRPWAVHAPLDASHPFPLHLPAQRV